MQQVVKQLKSRANKAQKSTYSDLKTSLANTKPKY